MRFTLALLCLCTAAHAQTGIASVYGQRECGRPVASGGVLHCGELTAAHRTLPFGTMVRVCRIGGNCILVKVVDRGPYVAGRIIDLTPTGAAALGFSERGAGLAHVTVEPIR